MKKLNISLLIIVIYSFSMSSQGSDTYVDVGGYNLHFNIIKGKGTPIVFEAGLGDDGAIWKNILNSIHKVTGATLITYDRAGFGKSEVNLKEKTSQNMVLIIQ